MVKYHAIAFCGGFLLDLILGDPYWLPHPIRLIGNAISFLEKALIGGKDQKGQEKWRSLSGAQKRRRGRLLVVTMLLSVVLVVTGLMLLLYQLHPVLGLIGELIMTYQLLATKCLRVESMKVYDKLKNGSLEEARYAVSMIVGRDTKELDEKQVARAAVETVAENTSDGCIAPMLYLLLGGPILGFAYKTINTMDSMVGYKSERYMDFGRCAAKLDDVVNYYPARISAVLMIVAAYILQLFTRGKYFSGRNAAYIFSRDRYKHASPNSAQTESVCAGALGLRLAGNASYFGVVHEKPYIGDWNREIEAEDIERANQLLYVTAILCEMAGVICMLPFMG